jgi:hypothetical protein
VVPTNFSPVDGIGGSGCAFAIDCWGMSGQTGSSLGEKTWPWSLSEGLARQLTAITCLTNRLRRKEVVEPMLLHCPTRHGDVVFQVISSFVAQSFDLSVWQDVQGLGILYLPVIAGEMNLKVCELTKVPGTPWDSIFGMWQATHSLPGLPSLWWVCSSRVVGCGPLGEVGP